jgi:hypothetical protein
MTNGKRRSKVLGDKLHKQYKKEIWLSQLWWHYSEGWSKCEASCLNFDQGKKVVKMSREVPYKGIHVIF